MKKIIENNYFIVEYPQEIEKFVLEVVSFADKKILEYFDFFKLKKLDEKIKCCFFISRDEFISYIENILTLDEELPSSWANGCFYGGEIQVLVDINNQYDTFYTMMHECCHLFMNKYIFLKERIVWLDEAITLNLDGTIKSYIENDEFKKSIYQLDSIRDMLNLYDYNYDLYRVIGRYLFEKYDDLYLYLENFRENKNIINESIDYFLEKYGG